MGEFIVSQMGEIKKMFDQFALIVQKKSCININLSVWHYSE